jgi:hypothetical protein
VAGPEGLGVGRHAATTPAGAGETFAGQDGAAGAGCGPAGDDVGRLVRTWEQLERAPERPGLLGAYDGRYDLGRYGTGMVVGDGRPVVESL